MSEFGIPASKSELGKISPSRALTNEASEADTNHQTSSERSCVLAPTPLLMEFNLKL